MQSTREKISFYLTAAVYIVFNLRLAGNLLRTVKATLWQILQTAPYEACATLVLVVFLEYLSGGEKIPWERRFRLFFTIGIIAGLFYAIYEYAGRGVPLQQ
jgi:hypothetical protein